MTWKRDDRAEQAWECVWLAVGVAGAGMALATAYFEMRRAQFELAKACCDIEYAEEENAEEA